MKCYDCGVELIEHEEPSGFSSWQHEGPAFGCPAFREFYGLAKTGDRAYKGAEAWEDGGDVLLPINGDAAPIDLRLYVVGNNRRWDLELFTFKQFRGQLPMAFQTSEVPDTIWLYREAPANYAVVGRFPAIEKRWSVILTHETLHEVLDRVGEGDASRAIDRFSYGSHMTEDGLW